MYVCQAETLKSTKFFGHFQLGITSPTFPHCASTLPQLTRFPSFIAFLFDLKFARHDAPSKNTDFTISALSAFYNSGEHKSTFTFSTDTQPRKVLLYQYLI